MVRTVDNPKNEPSGSRARTPHHLLKGTITPNGLHFTIMHAGIPDIDPAQHKLVIHGMVKQPLVFDLDALSRYPHGDARRHFFECGGNSARCSPTSRSRRTCRRSTVSRPAPNGPASALDPARGGRRRSEGKWIIAEGADAPHLTRSVPMEKAMDDAMVAHLPERRAL